MGGRGAGAERPGVGARAAGLLPSPAVGARFPAGQRRPTEAETPPRVVLPPCCTATVPPSGSLGRLRLVRGRVRVRAFALLCSCPCLCCCPHSLHPPNPSGGARVTGAAPVSSTVPVGLGGPADESLALSLQAAQVPFAAGNLPVCAGPLLRAAVAASLANPSLGWGPFACPQRALGL